MDFGITTGIIPLPKKLQLDACRRDSGMSTGSSGTEMTEADCDSKRPQQECTAWWKQRGKDNLADLLPENSYLYAQQGRYVFPGAELFYDPNEVTSDLDSDSSDSNNGSAADDDQCGPAAASAAAHPRAPKRKASD